MRLPTIQNIIVAPAIVAGSSKLKYHLIISISSLYSTYLKKAIPSNGLKPQQVDIEAQKFFTERDKKRALEDLLERHGVVKRFTKTFIPKD